MKWKVRLSGDETGLTDLCDSFDSDPKVFEEDEKHFIWTSQFKEAESPRDVQEIAEDLVQIIRNLGERDSLWVSELEASHVHQILCDGSEHVHAFDEGEITVARARTSVAPTSIDGVETEGNIHHRADRTYKRTQLALSDPKVRELISLLEKGNSWVNLYRIYEFIQDNTGGCKNTVERGWWTSSQKELFKRTANNRDAIGNDARHAKSNDPGPDDPMKSQEAKQIIGQLVDYWLQHRAQLAEGQCDRE